MDVDHVPKRVSPWLFHIHVCLPCPIGSMYAIYGNIHHQYTPNVSIYTIHGSDPMGVVSSTLTNEFATLTDTQRYTHSDSRN